MAAGVRTRVRATRMVSSRAPMPEASAAQQAVIAREFEALGALGTKRVEAAE
jgi:hypothetical protein